MERRLPSEQNGEPLKVFEQERVTIRTVLPRDEDAGVWRVDWMGRGWKPPDGTCPRPCSSSPQHQARGWPQRECSAKMTELHRTPRHFTFFFMVGDGWEGKYSQLQFQKLLNEEPKPNIPPGSGGQNPENL